MMSDESAGTCYHNSELFPHNTEFLELGGCKSWLEKRCLRERGRSPVSSRRTSPAAFGIEIRYRRQRRAGSVDRRNSHSSPFSCIQRGAWRVLPQLKSNAAPTPIMTGT